MEQDVRRELVINPQVRFHDYKNNLSFETERRNVRNVHYQRMRIK